jgi:hypothetical protein
MALPTRMLPAYAFQPSMMLVSGSFTPVAAGAATTNQQVQPALLTVSLGAQGQGLGPTETIAPLGAKIRVVANATSAFFPQVATNANNANVYVLDLAGVAGDIVQAQADLVRGPASTTTIQATSPNCAAVLGIDNVNKLVYVASVVRSSGALANTAAGDTIHFMVVVSDGYSA